MLLKRIGYVLIIKSKAYKVISLIAPILMLASLSLVFFLPHITLPYKFQQPALRTKISIVHPSTPTHPTIEYHNVYPGIRLALIIGRLSAESVLLISKCDPTTNQVFASVHQTIISNNRIEKKLLAKNVGFLCYNSTESIHSFIRYQTGDLHSPTLNLWNQLGIIRNALVFSFSPESTKQRKPRVFFNIYTPQSQSRVDLDFYQAIKELLQQVGVTKWQPCRQIEDSKIIAGLSRITGRRTWNFAFKHSLCHLHELGRNGRPEPTSVWPQPREPTNINYIFQEAGIQAGTIEVRYHKTNQTEVTQQMSRLGLSFLEEFVVLEDHLHSSSTLYLPLSQSEYIPLKALIIPGITYVVVTAAYLIIKAINILNQTAVSQSSSSLETQQLKLNQVNPTIVLLLGAAQSLLVQFYLNRTFFISILCASLVRSILKKGLSNQQRELARVVLAGWSIFLCLYCSIFCFPLSVVLMVLTNILCFVSKPGGAVILFIGLVGLMHFGQLGLAGVWDQIIGVSPLGQIATLPLLLWILVV